MILAERKRLGLMWAVLYIGSIFGANWLITRFGLVPVGFGLVAPAGVYAAGLALTFRDFLQDMLGRWVVVVAILVGAGLSATLGGTLWLASGTAFLFSELADLSIYTPLRERSWPVAIAASNTVGAFVDSVIFLWLAFHSLAFLPGQMVGKMWATVPFVVLTWKVRQMREVA